MNEPLDEPYFKWLYSQVCNSRFKNPARTYWSLLRRLYVKEFVWSVANDDNRVEDGRDLRFEFMESHGIENDVDVDWLGLGCSMLEMLIGLSRRLSFEDDGEPREWFWRLLENVDLARYTDMICDRYTCHEEIDRVLDRVIFREYDADGRGGLFPLNHARRDQRDVELWYQLSAYLIEHT